MKESYRKGVAVHPDPESCVCRRKAAGEALTGAQAGRASSCEINYVRGADAVSLSGRQHRRQRQRELAADPARSENLCMRGTSRRENREIPWLPVRVIAGRAAQGRLRP